jgi:hypothetical protein
MEEIELKNKAHEMLAALPNEALKEAIAKSRWTCDSNWMMAMVAVAGWEAANKMNIHSAKATGKAEMHRLMKLLNMEKPKNKDELMLLVTLAMESFITKDYFDYTFIDPPDGPVKGIIRQCYAFTKVSSIGIEKDYECGCFGMRAGWYQAMGVDVKERLGKCLKSGDDCCEIAVEDFSF